MRNTILKKAIPAVLIGAISMDSGHGMEAIEPTKSSLQTNKIFLGIYKGDFVGYGDPAVFKEFSSERLTYRLPDIMMQEDIVALVSSEEIYKTLFRGGENLRIDQIHLTMMDNFSSNQQLRAIKVTGSISTYRLPNTMIWGVISNINNQLVGFISYDHIESSDAKESAPEGDLHEFYVKDMKNNPYVNISYAVSPNHQRQGYATEMSLALMETLFQHSNAEVIVHTSIDSNIGSARSAQTCCFMQKGVSQGENFRILRKSSQMRLMEESKNPAGIEQPKTEEGRLLESLVFDLVKQKAITMNLRNMSNLKINYGAGRFFTKLPQDINELRNWCANGYQFGVNEKSAPQELEISGRLLSTQHYSFRLFCYGIHKGCLPLVRYVLEYHNNIWNRNDLGNELTFSFANSSGTSAYSNFTMITYLIKKNFLEIFDYGIKNEDFRDFTFGPGMKNAMGNTPFHTMAKYGSQAMIERFLMEKDLVDLCLNQDNIKGESGRNPLQIAEALGKSEGILSLLREVVLPKIT